jgi:Tfp pilus assembly protein PilZ
MEKDNPEKRINARIEHQTPVMLEHFEAGIMHAARMHNYSKKGLYFESDFYLIPGSEIYIGIADSPFASEPGVYECYRSVIKWRKFLENSFYDYGYGIEIQTRIQRPGKAGPGRDSRRQSRRPCSIPTLIQNKNSRIPGIIQNVNNGGVFVQCSEKPSKGQKVSLTIPLKQRQKLVSRLGEIVWCDENGIGIRFQNDAPKQ